MSETTGEVEITKRTKVPLELVFMTVAMIVALLAQWGNMRLELAALDAKHAAAEASLDAKHAAAEAALEAKFNADKTKAGGDHKLLCAIATKLNVIGGDCP